MTSREIADLYADLELRLIQSLRRNLAAHKSQEQAEGGQNGVPARWPAWQAEKLRSLNRFRQQNEKIADEFSTRIDAETRAMLEGQFAEADGSENAFFGVNADKVGALIDEMTAIEENVQKAALRYMDDVYRQTILRADAALTAGGMTMQQAVDLAVKDFLRQGITCIRYKNGRLVNIATYAEMALRTSNTRAMLLGEAQKRERMGVDTVLVSQYGACSDTCLPWQGLVYIDDVWQPYHGDSNATRGGSYGYSRNGRSYPLLSVAVKAGLFHPNCRHTLGTWIEGVSRRPKPMDKAKIEAASKMEAKQRRMELAVRRDKRLVAGTQDAAQVKEYKARLRRDQKALREFIAEHDDVLRRDRWRERNDLKGVTVQDIQTAIRGAGGERSTGRNPTRLFLGKIDPADAHAREALAQAFCERYADAKVETMMVITRDGEVHLMTDNDPKGVDCSYLGDKLKGSWNIHNHPPDTTQFSFSTDADLPGFFADGSAVMEAVDYKYRYRFERPDGISFEQWDAVRYQVERQIESILEQRGFGMEEYELFRQHTIMDEICKRLNISSYSRQKR